MQLSDMSETSGMEKISKILVDILEILMTNGPSKSIVEDFDIFKLLFLTYPLMQESTERVMLSLLFQYQNELDFIQRIFQDLITIVELKDSIEYFPDLKKKHKASLHRKNNHHTVDPTENSKTQEERENRVHRKKPVYFEELVEFSVCDTIKINVDNLKIKAMDFLEKVLRIFELVLAAHQNFQDYYAEADKQPPFDPYLMLISAWENTNVREVQQHIRATFKKIASIDFFSKQSFSFQTDLNELSTRLSPVHESEYQMREGSNQTSFEEDHDADSDLFSQCDSEDSDEKEARRVENALHSKVGGKNHLDKAMSVDDKNAIIQDWLFNGTRSSPRKRPSLHLERAREDLDDLRLGPQGLLQAHLQPLRTAHAPHRTRTLLQVRQAPQREAQADPQRQGAVQVQPSQTQRLLLPLEEDAAHADAQTQHRAPAEHQPALHERLL